MTRPSVELVADPPSEQPLIAFAWTTLDGELLEGSQPRLQFPAVSTLKLLVLIAVFRRIDAHEFDLDDECLVHASFHSAASGEPFEIPDDDRDPELAKLLGQRTSIRELIERMITVSSNDATNLLLERTGFEQLAQLAEELEADGVVVQRPIGDGAAQRAGLLNRVSPIGLCRLLAAIGTRSAASASSCDAMLQTLLRQQYRDEIPAGLPESARVANKNGWDPGLLHDAALVFPDDAPAYCLSVCTSGFPDYRSARTLIRQRSRLCYEQRGRLSRSRASSP